MAYTSEFFKQAGETGTVTGTSFFSGTPSGARKSAFGTGFAVKMYTGGTIVFYKKICFSVFRYNKYQFVTNNTGT
jgi:hypothetical protein